MAEKSGVSNSRVGKTSYHILICLTATSWIWLIASNPWKPSIREYLPQDTTAIHTVINSRVTIIKRTDKIHILQADIVKHNQELLNSLRLFVQIDYAREASDRALNDQMRALYVTVLVGLLSFSLRRPGNGSRLLILGFILVMYGIEVNRNDLNLRVMAMHGIDMNALKEMLNSDSLTLSWYELTTDSLAVKTENLSKSCLYRKFFAVCQPNLEQCVFYAIPWDIFLIYLVIQHRRRRKKTEFSESM